MGQVFWDDLDVGDAVPTETLFLSKERVRAYARAAGMLAARFTDDEGARQEGLPGMITPGNMSMGLLSKMVTDWAPGAVLKRLGVTFRGLVLPDRTVRLHGNVTDKQASGRDHTVELDLWLESDEGERWVIGTATVALPVRGAPGE
jgi:acyl dehydratase